MSIHRTFILRELQHFSSLTTFLSLTWEAFANQDKPLQVEVTEYKSKRSVEQNRRYWMLLRTIAEQTWMKGRRYSDEVWHEMFKRQFIGMDELPNGGTYGLSTTTLSVSEFADYMTRVEEHAASQLGVVFDG